MTTNKDENPVELIQELASEDAQLIDELNKALNSICELAIQNLKADIVTLYPPSLNDEDAVGKPIIHGALFVPGKEAFVDLRSRDENLIHFNRIVRMMLQRREPFFAENAKEDWKREGFYGDLPRDLEPFGFVEREKIASSAGIPLLVNNFPIGVLFVNYRKKRKFTSVIKSQIEVFSKLASIAISNSVNYERLRHAKDEQEAITDLVRQINHQVRSETKSFYKIVKQQVSKLIDTSNFYIALYDSSSDTYSFPCFVDSKDSEGEIRYDRVSKGITEYVRVTKRPLLATKEQQLGLDAEKKITLLGTPSEVWLGAPLILEKEAIGVIAVQNYDDETVYGDSDLELLGKIAVQISSAIHLHQVLTILDREIEQTGALNRALSEIEENNEVAQIIRSLLRSAVFLTKARSAVYLRSDQQKKVVRVAEVYRSELKIGLEIPFGKGLAGQVAVDGKPRRVAKYLEEVDKMPDEIEASGSASKFGAVIAIPLVVEDLITGVMVLSDSLSGRVFTDSDEKILKDFSQLVAISINKAHSHYFLETLFEDSPFALIERDITGKITRANRAACELFQYPESEMKYKLVRDIIFWDKKREPGRIQSLLDKSEGHIVREETSIRTKNGAEIPVLLSISPHRDYTGEYVIGSIGLFEDQRDLGLHGRAKKLFAAIEHVISGEQLSEVADSCLLHAIEVFQATEGLVLLNKNDRLHVIGQYGISVDKDFSPNISELIAITEGSFMTILHSEEFGILSSLLSTSTQEALLVSLTSQDYQVGYLVLASNTLGTFNDRDQLMELFSTPVSIALSRAQLLDERKGIQAQFSKRAFSAAASNIALGVMHEIKNALASVSLNLVNLRKKLRKIETNKLQELEKLADDMEHEIDKVQKLSVRLQKFGIRTREERKLAYLNEIVTGTLELVSSAFDRKKLKFSLELDNSLNRPKVSNISDKILGNPIMVDTGQIEQVIVNFVNNAIDASHQRGVIQMRTQLFEGNAQFAIRDFGEGIPESFLKEIYNPFATTKPEGIGLGLYMSRQMIHQNHHGYIDFVRHSQGTEFYFLIPLYDKKRGE